MKTILFVCTGNTCRSPMAEAIARSLIERGEVRGAGTEVFVASAGVAAGDGIPMSEDAVVALRRLGIEHDGTSKRLTPEMVRRATLVLGMTGGHVAEIRRMLASAPELSAAANAAWAGGESTGVRIERLDPERDVDDPVGMGGPAYDRLATQFVRLLPKRLSELIAS